MAVEQDQQFIEYVVKNIVDHPDEVVIERSVDDRGVLLKMSVNPEDMGKIIGKGGATAKAIRTLLRVLGSKNDERLNLKIIDTDSEGNEIVRESHAPTSERAEAPAHTESSQEADDQPQSTDEQAEDDEVASIRAKAREGLDDLNLDI